MPPWLQATVLVLLALQFGWPATNENGNTTQFAYDSAGRLTCTYQPAVIDAKTSSSTQPTTRTIYDAGGNVAATINPLGNQWDYSYDALNRKIQELAPSADGTSARPVTQWNYDATGKVVAAIDAKGNETDTVYDRAGRVTDVNEPAVARPGGGTVRPNVHSTYDADGNVVTLTDPNGHTTRNAYDLLNRLLSTTDAANLTVTNTYDPVGNKLSVADGKNQVTAFAYDGLNRNLTVTDAAGDVTTLGYDALNKISRTDALGQVTAYSYDARNRLTGVGYTPSNANNRARVYAYDAVGNLTSVTEAALTAANVASSYDALNRVLTESSNGISHQYAYDLAGNRLTAVYDYLNTGTSRTLTSSYDALNRLGTLVEGTRTTHYGYDLNGNLTQKVLPNGDTETDTFDALNRALSQVTVTGATPAATFSYAYGYDLAGNVTSVAETYPSGLNNRTVNNTYDAINRLTTEAVTGTAPNVITTYTYDGANNRTEKNVSGPGSPGITTYSYNKLNQLLSFTLGSAVTSYTYDANGNRLTRTQSGATDTYGYDAENRLVTLQKNTTGGAGAYSYQYDYRTRRITRTEVGVTTSLVFSGGTSVREYTGATGGAPTVEFLRGSDYGGGVGGILYSLRGGTPSYTHENKRGDVVAKTSASGSLTYQAQYAAFGNQVQTSGSTLDRQKSNSKDTDPTNLVDEGFRYRDLETGMFLTRDPAGFVDGPNEYTYVIQNPWTSFDPEGLQTAPPPPPAEEDSPADNIEDASPIDEEYARSQWYSTRAPMLGDDSASEAPPPTGTPANSNSNTPVQSTPLPSSAWGAPLEPLIGDGTEGSIPPIGETPPQGQAPESDSSKTTRDQNNVIMGPPAPPAPQKSPAQQPTAQGQTSAATTRLAQDAAVNPTPPAALPTNRPIGSSPTQNAQAQAQVQSMQRAGYRDIRVNQQQVNAQGQRVGINRPDVQGTNSGGTREYYEYDRESSKRGSEHRERIQNNDPDGSVTTHTAN